MKQILTLALISLSTSIFAQVETPFLKQEERVACTVGILNGGGSLVGTDLEFLLSNKFGLQVGAGFLGYGAGMNFHFKPTIRSSFISLQYWNQGIGNSFAQSVIGPNFVFRDKKWFTFQLGAGKVLREGPQSPYDRGDAPSVILMYSIGAYFPIG